MGKLTTKYDKSTDVEAALDKGVEALAKTSELKEDLSELDSRLTESITEIKDSSKLNKNLFYGVTQNKNGYEFKYNELTGEQSIKGTPTTGGRIRISDIHSMGGKYVLYCNDTKPTMYVMNGSSVVHTWRETDTKPQVVELNEGNYTLEVYLASSIDLKMYIQIEKSDFYTKPELPYADNKLQTNTMFGTLKYEAIGDSLTYGFTGFVNGQQARLDKPYPELVGEILGISSVINKGETGTTVADDVDKMGSYYPMSNQNRMAGYVKADIISIMGGTNDYDKATELGRVGASSETTTFYAGWKIIFENLRARFPDAFIFAIIPPITKGYNIENAQSKTAKMYVEAIRDVCNFCGIPYLDMSVMGRLGQPNRNKYTNDGTHFTQEYVTRIFAPSVAKFIKDNYN